MDDITKIDIKNLGKEDLQVLKLKMEVSVLREQIKKQAPEKHTALEKIYKFLLKNIGPIGTTIVLLGGVVNPVLNYMASQRKDKLIHVNNDLIKIVNDTASASIQSIETVSIQDPNYVAPYLLDRLSAKEVDRELAVKIYTRMYGLNTELSHYSFSDQVLFLFTKSNKKILEDELYKHAAAIFKEKPENLDAELIIMSYLDMIYECKLIEKKRFRKEIEMLNKNCGEPEYEKICNYLKVLNK